MEADFSGRLRAAINGQSIARVAKQAKISRRHLHRLLAGATKHGAYVGTLEAIARACRVEFTWLAEGQGEMRHEAPRS